MTDVNMTDLSALYIPQANKFSPSFFAYFVQPEAGHLHDRLEPCRWWLLYFAEHLLASEDVLPRSGHTNAVSYRPPIPFVSPPGGNIRYQAFFVAFQSTLQLSVSAFGPPMCVFEK